MHEDTDSLGSLFSEFQTRDPLFTDHIFAMFLSFKKKHKRKVFFFRRLSALSHPVRSSLARASCCLALPSEVPCPRPCREAQSCSAGSVGYRLFERCQKAPLEEFFCTSILVLFFFGGGYGGMSFVFGGGCFSDECVFFLDSSC